MKQAITFFSFLLLLISCQQPEHGAPDNETLSRKLFDTMRDGDFGKSELLMPDKGTFRKIGEQNGQKIDDVTKDYKAFTDGAEKNFNQIHDQLNKQGTLKYIRSTTEPVQNMSLPTEMVIAKIDSDNGPVKFSFTAVKFNNRWYYNGNVQWVEKID